MLFIYVSKKVLYLKCFRKYYDNCLTQLKRLDIKAVAGAVPVTFLITQGELRE
jgi:hypothetical protein